MSEDDTAQILRDMKKIGSEFGRKATALSNVLRVIESTLKEMDGKVEAEEHIDESRVLVFARWGNGWALRVRNSSDAQNTLVLNDIDIETKALVGKALPGLVKQIVEIAGSRLASVNEALEALEEIPWLDIEAASREDEVPF